MKSTDGKSEHESFLGRFWLLLDTL